MSRTTKHATAEPEDSNESVPSLRSAATAVGGALLDQLRTPAGRHRRVRGPLLAHVSGRRSALVGCLGVLVLGLLAPLLLLTPLAPGSPAHYAQDPAVRALETYERALDRSPTARRAATAASAGLGFTTLSNGTLKAWRVGRGGQCFYLLVSAVDDAPPSGVRPGVPADCATTP